MASHPTTGSPVHNLVDLLFTPVKIPQFMSPRRLRENVETFGENVAVKMSQRTLLLILGASIAATLAWTNLKSEASKNHDLILDLTAVRASDVIDRKADHDLLMRVAEGVERLERRADREDRRNSQNNH